jgi:ADP-ribose pyrophosphatase YjhB (NUDIX family)
MSEPKTTFIFHPSKLLDVNEYKPTQIYGFCKTSDNLVCLVRDKDEERFTLPGGGIDEGENPEEALIREFKEEAQFELKTIKLLGSLEVIVEEEGKPTEKTQQIRYICEAENVEEFVPEKDGWETVERIWIYYKDLPKYLKWIKYESGQSVYKAFCDLIEN